MQIETLGDAFTHSARITMFCNHGKRDGMYSIRECQFEFELDMMTLLCTRGRDMPISMLRERLKCPRCGSRQVVFVMKFPDQPNAQPARIVGARR